MDEFELRVKQIFRKGVLQDCGSRLILDIPANATLTYFSQDRMDTKLSLCFSVA